MVPISSSVTVGFRVSSVTVGFCVSWLLLVCCVEGVVGNMVVVDVDLSESSVSSLFSFSLYPPHSSQTLEKAKKQINKFV